MDSKLLCAAAGFAAGAFAVYLLNKRAKRDGPFELRYFPVMAKGLGPTLVAEHSGQPWKGNKDLGFIARGGPPGKNFADIKDTLPFGQLPLLTTSNGEKIAQTTAIVNYIGMVAGTEGSGRDYAVSQMLIAEAEDIYAMTNKNVPTIVAPLNQGIKGDKVQQRLPSEARTAATDAWLCHRFSP